MARIRTIKPDFFTSEDIVELSPFARLLYIALWCEADREGRLSWKTKTFKMRYFPGDDVDIDALCEELTNRNLVVLYGEACAYIPTFLEHQHINPRETQSALPDPKQSTREARVSDASIRDSDAQGGRKEGKGKERKDASCDAAFDEFWQTYPNKASKAAAVKAWTKLRMTDDLKAKIMTAVSVAKQSAGWIKDNGQYVPHAATWLNGQRWEDQQGSNGQNTDFFVPPGKRFVKGIGFVDLEANQ